MKTRITLLMAALFFSFSASFAQQDEECMTNLTIFTDNVKSKKYDEAHEPWKKVRGKCPKFNLAIYAYGEKILKHKIKNASGAEKIGYINDLMKLWDERLIHFSNKTKKGKVEVNKAELKYKYRKELGLNNSQLYDMFDAPFKNHLTNFTSPKGLYTYFSLMVDLFDAKKKPAQELFNKYDEVIEKVETEVKRYSEKLNKLAAKEDAGTELTKKEGKRKKSYGSYLEAYATITGSIDQKLGDRANCATLIPLYNKDFEANKGDAQWLKGAVNRMFNKECTDDPLYIKLVKAYDKAAPSSDTKYFVATLLLKDGKTTEALSYFQQSFDLEEDNFKKAKKAEKIGLILKKKGSFGKARGYFRKSLSLNPSNGRPHLSIATMYAKSANNCGDNTFNKRAVYWYAALEAQKAGRVDPTQRKAAAQSAASYKAKAPSKSDCFVQGIKTGDKIKIACWIGATVTVPNL